MEKLLFFWSKLQKQSDKIYFLWGICSIIYLWVLWKLLKSWSGSAFYFFPNFQLQNVLTLLPPSFICFIILNIPAITATPKENLFQSLVRHSTIKTSGSLTLRKKWSFPLSISLVNVTKVPLFWETNMILFFYFSAFQHLFALGFFSHWLVSALLL